MSYESANRPTWTQSVCQVRSHLELLLVYQLKCGVGFLENINTGSDGKCGLGCTSRRTCLRLGQA